MVGMAIAIVISKVYEKIIESGKIHISRNHNDKIANIDMDVLIFLTTRRNYSQVISYPTDQNWYLKCNQFYWIL